MARTRVQIEKSLGDRITGLDPTKDVLVGGIPDVFIIPEAAEIASLESRQDSIGYRYAWEYTKTQDRATQILYGSNHGLRPSTGAPTQTRGVAYRYTRPSQNVFIGAGNIVTTTDGSISFKIGYDTVMYADRADSYFNASKRRYEVPITLISVGTGTTFEVPPYALRKLGQTIEGIDGAENTVRAQDSKPEETIQAYGRRIQAKFNGLDLSNPAGFRQLLMNYAPTLVLDVICVFSSDTQYFERRTRRAAWDVYIRGERLEDTETVFTADGVSSEFVLPRTPVHEVTEVRINGIVTPYSFIPDTNPETRGSVIATDKILLGFVPAAGTSVTVKYVWNSLIGQLNSYINQTRAQAYRTDILVREARPVYVRIRLGVQPTTTFDTQEVLANTTASVYAYMDDTTRREFSDPEMFRSYVRSQTAGIRNLYVRTYTYATSGTLDVETIDLAPYEYVATNDTILTVERV